MPRYFLGAIFIILGLFALSYLQGRFDHGDERRAFEALQAKVPELQGASCSTQMESRWRGVVRVSCAERSWLVDVVGAHIVEEK